MRKRVFRCKLLLTGIIGAAILTGCGAKKKGAADYITASFHGINGEGTMTLTFDRDALKEEIASDKKMTEREKETLDSLLSGIEKDYILSKTDSLSNGDKVEIKGGLEKNLLKDYGIAFDNNAVTVTVEGLAEGIEINVTDYLSGTADGFEGGGSYSLALDRQGIYDAVGEQAALVEGKAPETAKLWTTVDECLSGLTIDSWYFTELSTGDKIHADVKLEKAEMPEYGITFTAEDFEDEVSGLAPYETIDVSSYLTLSMHGYDTFADAYVVMDREKLSADLAGILKNDGRTAYGRAQEGTDYAEEAEKMLHQIENGWKHYFDTALSASENVKNGDKIGITVTRREDLAEVRIPEIGVILEGGSTEEEVKGLPETASMDISDYISLSFEGFEGAGSASVAYDEEGFVKALNELICSQDGSLDPETFSYYRGSYYLTRSTVNTEGLTALKNGQKVTAEVVPYAESIPEYGIIFEASPVETEAAGLAEPEEIDLTGAVNVTFSGICPFVTASREVNRDCPVYYETSLSDIYGDEEIRAENGDTYEIQITYDPEELLRMGYVVTDDTCSFTVSGLDTWTIDLENADDDRLETYASQAENLAWQEFNRYAGDIAGTFTEGNGWVIWKDVRLQTEKVWYGVTPEDARYGNELCFTGSFIVPVRGTDRGITEKEAGYTVWIRNVRENPQGRLISDNEPGVRLYYSGEDYEEEMRAGILYELGEGAEILEMEKAPAEQEETVETAAESEAPESVAEDVTEAVEGASVSVAEDMPEAAETAEGASAEVETDPEHPQWTAVKKTVTPVYADPAVTAQAYGEPIVFDGHTYYQFTQIDEKPFTWTQAKMFCEEAGGHLATIGSIREQYAINELLKEREKNCYWIGASDKEFEGEWTWVTGEPFSFRYFRVDGQPDNYEGSENYLALYTDYSGRWNDLAHDGEEAGFILEMEPDAPADEPGNQVYLAELEPVLSANTDVWESIKDPYGNVYFESLALNAGNRAAVEYELDGGYEKLIFTLSTSEDADSEASMDLLIYGDRKLIFNSSGYTRSDAPVTAEISVSGVKRLQIQTVSRRSSGYLFLNDAELVPAEETEEGSAEKNLYLSDLECVFSQEAEIMTGQGVQNDISGNMLRDALKLSTGYQGEVTFRIPNGADAFSANLSMGSVPTAENIPAYVEFYGDDSPLGKYTVSAYDGIIPVELDLSGARLLTIKAGNQGETGNQQAVISDICITEMPAEERAGLPDPVFPEIRPDYEEKAAAVLTYGNRRYYRYDEPMPYEKMREYCQEAGGMPAVIHTPDENRAVTKLMESGIWSTYDGYWIGCTYDPEGRFWRWDDDTALQDAPYQNWSPDYSSGNDILERFAYIGRDGTWNTDVKGARRGFIMQVSAADASLPDGGESLVSLEPLGMDNSEMAELSFFEGKFTEYLPDSLRMNAEAAGYAEYVLDGKYKALTARVDLTADSDVNSRADIAVFGDGVLLYSRIGISKASLPVSFMADLTGVQNLKIMSRSRGYASFCLEDPMLYPAEEEEKETVGRLSELTVVDSRGFGYDGRMVKDIYGGVHDCAETLEASGEGFVLYNLEGRYTTLTFNLVSTADTLKYGERRVRILLDEETVYEDTLVGYFGAPEAFTFDVTGKSTLRIETSPIAEGRDYIFVVDDGLR